MKPTLQFRLSQHLTLTPQLQQSIRLLQLSTVELNQEIERLLMENPVLQREDGESDAAAGTGASSQEREAPTGTSADEAQPSNTERNEKPPADFAAPWPGVEDNGTDDDGDAPHAPPHPHPLRHPLPPQLPLTTPGP